MWNVVLGYLFLGFLQHLQGLVFLTLSYELRCQLREQAAVGVAHAQNGLVEIEIGIVDATELEAVHHVVIHLLGVDTLACLLGVERSDAVGKTFLHEVITQVAIVLRTDGHGHIERTLPVAAGEHLIHHHLTLIDRTLSLQ